MTIKTAGVLGAVTLLAGAGVAQAMPGLQHDLDSVMTPTTYAELLQPIPNAAALLAASDAQAALLPLAREGEGAVENAQFYHHHHHHFRGPFFHHHHHGFYRGFYHHHHHHHHHHFFRRDYY